MNDDNRHSTVLSLTQCWDLLAGTELGRLVTSVDGRPSIFPVNFAVQDRTILFRTGQGTKLVSTAVNNQVLFEVDGYTHSAGWSVIVSGVARSVRDDEDLAIARRAELKPWTGSDKEHYVRILPRNVTGRHFQFDTGPARQLPVDDPVLG
jgi:nitroimidazol reductase NimA-like FMN-containing flavoprotein (pyridoxamine 5'-phosphate oxidase superfamily)